jgi:transposase
MGRKAVLPPTIFDHDFAALAKKESHARTRIRFIGLSHVQKGQTYKKISIALNVNPNSIANWVERFAVDGIDGLQEKPGRGAKAKFSMNRADAFRKSVLKAQEEKSGGRIKGADIQKILLDQFNTKCSLSSVYDLLHRLNLVWISVRSKHPKQDQVVQDEFKKISKKM